MKGTNGCSLEKSGALETFKAKGTAQAEAGGMWALCIFKRVDRAGEVEGESHYLSLKPVSLSAAKFTQSFTQRCKQFKLHLMGNKREMIC